MNKPKAKKQKRGNNQKATVTRVKVPDVASPTILFYKDNMAKWKKMTKLQGWERSLRLWRKLTPEEKEKYVKKSQQMDEEFEQFLKNTCSI